MTKVQDLIRRYTNDDVVYQVNPGLQELLDFPYPGVGRTITGRNLTGNVSAILHTDKGLQVVKHMADLTLEKDNRRHMKGRFSHLPDCNHLRYGMELSVLAYLESERTGLPVYRLTLIHMEDDCKSIDYAYRPEMVEAILEDYKADEDSGDKKETEKLPQTDEGTISGTGTGAAPKKRRSKALVGAGDIHPGQCSFL